MHPRTAVLGLILGLGLVSCQGGAEDSGEIIPPLKLLGPGVPADLPALKTEDFAVLRLGLHG